MTEVAALDLGTTRIKGGRFDRDGHLHEVISRDAPTISAGNESRESSPEGYLATATEVLDALIQAAPPAIALGLASQRSTFTIWNARSGEALIPLISWQDRRASDWCVRHLADAPTVGRLTGLRLSPHYAGPKLAALVEKRPDLIEGLATGALKFGTLDAWLIWNWSSGRVHETDQTMAARTLLADPRSRRWQPTLLSLFGIRTAGLPSIELSCGRTTRLDQGVTLTASVADQPAAALTALGEQPGAVLVNLGTGGFVVRATGQTMMTIPGYLSGPILAADHELRFALEGTINGAGSSVDGFASPPTRLADSDLAPDAFALPDQAGVGSPHWRADVTFTLSPAADHLDAGGTRRTVAEGIVFRVREILEGLTLEADPPAVRMSGGLSRDPFFAAALAACLNRTVDVFDEGEQTLRGAAWLAAGRPTEPLVRPRLRRVAPAVEHGWLRDKYPRWQRWMARVLAA